MAWTYLVALEDLLLPYKIGCDQPPIVKLTDTLEPSYFLEYQKANSLLPQFGTMCKRLQKSTFPYPSISSMEDSPAKISALQDAEKVWKESEADYFSRSCDLFEKFDLPLFSSKTSQLSEIADWIQSQKKFPMRGMIVDGRIYQLPKLERGTKGIDGGYLPTPVSTPRGSHQGATFDPKSRRQTDRTLDLYVKTFPTPTARDFRTPCEGDMKRNTPSLATIAYQTGGQLSPMWVEWLMGYPIEWTELSAWAMQLFPSRQRKRLKNYSE
jgi:hypothetical protein